MSSRLATRLTAPTLAVSLLLLAVGAGAAWYVHRLQRTTARLLAINVASVRSAEELEIGMREIQSRLDRSLITGDPRYLDDVPTLRTQTDHWLDEAERVATTTLEQDWLRKARAGYDRFFTQMERVAPAPAGPARDAEYAVLDRIFTEDILEPVHDYLNFNVTALQKASEINEEQSGRIVLGLLLLAALGSALGLALGWLLAMRLRRSLVQVQVLLQDAAGMLGDATGTVRVEHGDDAGDLDAAARRLAGPIGELVERLHRSRREIIHAEQLARVGQMAAGIAHEVRNPLTAIKILVQAALDRGPDAQLGGHDLRVLDEEIGRLERLTSTFLDFARPPRPDLRPLDLNEVAAHTLRLVEPRAELQGISLHADLADKLPPVAGDFSQLHMVLFNLLSNALDASPTGSEVHLIACPRGEAVEVRVEDRGSGLPHELGNEFSRHLSAPRKPAWDWGCPSVAASPKLTAAPSTLPTAKAAALVSPSPCRWPAPNRAGKLRPWEIYRATSDRH